MLSAGRGNTAKEVQEAYARRLTEATNSMISNYSAILKSMKIEDDSRLTSTNQAFQDNYEVMVNASSDGRWSMLAVMVNASSDGQC